MCILHATDTQAHQSLEEQPIAEPSERELMDQVAAIIPVKWRDVGCELGIPGEKLNAIEYQYRDPKRCFSEVFLKWKSQGTPPYTWATIIKALRSRQVNEIRIAKHLEVTYL